MPRQSRLIVAALALVAGAALARSGEAQASRDSALALREARQEQARFEATRRRFLEVVPGSGGGRCDERIGRFCLNHTEESETEDTPEPPRIGEARDAMLARLERIAVRAPGDRWIAGQRVRYLVEGRRFRDARAVAAECRAEAWWCAGLVGLAAHFQGDPGPADSAFTEMLRRMPAEDRARWLEMEALLEPALVRWLRRLPPPDRERAEARYWAFADPFFARPGNEIRSEHLARSLLDNLQDRAETTENLSWGGDLREILIRYGWPTGWSKVRQSGAYYDTEIGYTSRMAGSDQLLLPPPAIFLDSTGVSGGVWDEEIDAPRAAYGIPMADSLVRWHYPVEHQLAVFHRGDSAVVVGAWALDPDSVPADHPLEAALALVGDSAGVVAVARTSGAGATGAIAATAPARRAIASIELVQEGARRVGRARRGLAIAPLPRGRIAVSDLLLLRDSAAPPASLEEAVRAARGSTRVRARESVGVYWEVYGVGEPTAGGLTVSLSVAGGRAGLLRRIAERARILAPGEPARLRWEEAPDGQGVLARTVALQIPALPRGDYSVEVEVRAPGQPAAVARQRITVSE